MNKRNSFKANRFQTRHKNNSKKMLKLSSEFSSEFDNISQSYDDQEDNAKAYNV